MPNASVSIAIGGRQAATTYIGEAPEEIAGLLQSNVTIAVSAQ